MECIFSARENRQLRHFFYGSTPATVSKLIAALVSRFGEFNMVGMHCPPMRAPGFSEDAAKFLTKERDIVGAGVDTLSLDIAAASKFVAHLAFLGAGKYGVELIANLNTVPPSGATIVVGGPKHEGASGGPCRVYALV